MYDIIFVTGELYFDHPLCGTAVLKRLLEKKGYKVGVIESPKTEVDIKKLGAPRLFFGISAGSIDSMVRNYTPLKKKRELDKNLNYDEFVPDRATIVYSNWIRKNFKDSTIVLGGTEASLRRFTHYDYWENRLRRPILFDSRAHILVYGSAEKQVIEIADKLKNHKSIDRIDGTCITHKEVPEDLVAVELPSFKEVSDSKEKFCDMQNKLSNHRNLIQKIDNRYLIQYRAPGYTPEDLDEYYSLDFSRKLPKKMSGFEFSILTHRGCIGGCNFCAVKLMQGDRIVSRSEESILTEIKKITKMKHFKGNIDDLGGASANMYGIDCNNCGGNCIDCDKLDRSNKRLIALLRKSRKIPGVKKIIVRSGVRYDIASPEYIKEMAQHHILDTLRIAPEHVNKDVLRLMNKNKGDLRGFIKEFKKTGRKLSFYYMTAHPGSSMKEARELAEAISKLKNAETVQVFTPTPMTVSTCMYYTGMDPKTKKKVYVPYSYREKKEQKRLLNKDESGLKEINRKGYQKRTVKFVKPKK
ncbi:YgiQ family radical SAM protein [Candidatus Woesearchaeota archaeon]|nr:YgiQ family radical SAM protein [Candidatus Woesearchaeota archaeon]